MTIKTHLRSVSRAASQRLGILWSSWRVLHHQSLLVRFFRGFVLSVLSSCVVLSVLEYCSAVLCPAADTHLMLLDRVWQLLTPVSHLAACLSGTFPLSICCSLVDPHASASHPMHAIPDPLVDPHASTLRSTASVFGASAGYTWYLGRSSVFFCIFSIQNLTVSKDFYTSVSIWLDLYGTTMAIACLMAWDWRVLRAESMLLCRSTIPISMRRAYNY